MAALADDESDLILRIQAIEDDIVLREAMIDSLSLAVNASPSRGPAIRRDLENLQRELAHLKSRLSLASSHEHDNAQYQQQRTLQKNLFVHNSSEEPDADASPLAKRSRFAMFGDDDGDEAPLFVYDTEETLRFGQSPSSSSSVVPPTLSHSHSNAANSASDASAASFYSDEFFLSLGLDFEEQARLELGFNTRKRERESELATQQQQELEDARLARQLEQEEAQESEKKRLQQMRADEALAKVLAAKWGAAESSSTSTSTPSAPLNASNSFVIDDDEDAWGAPPANQLEDDERLARQLQAEEDLLIKEGLLPHPPSPHRPPAGAQARQLSPPPLDPALQDDMLQVWRDLIGVAPVSPSLPPSPAPLPPQPQASPQDLLATIHAPEDLAPHIPRTDQPDGLLSSLMEHQKIGLAWMVSMEEGNVKGGILADDMGLGKTVQSIALMLARPYRPPSQRKPTLIIAPVALVHQWAGEIKSKVDSGRLSVYLHHGPKRATEAKELEKYDVVITTYNLLSIEASITSDSSSSRRWPLAECKFHRVILDEAHVIKNSATGQARGCFNIDADFRWCLTATPIQNSYEDLFSLIHFLRVKPYCERVLFQREIAFAIKMGRPSGIETLQNVVKAIMLRRTKLSRVGGQPILTLPQRNVHVTHAPFSDDESRFYERLEEKAVRAFRRYMDTNSVMRNYSQVLVLLLRLRQACLHSSLIQDIEDVGAHAGQVVVKWAENQQAVLEVAQKMSKDVVKRVSEEGLDGYECPICMDLAVDPKIVFLCGHIYCNECLMGHLNRPGNDGEKTCPGCRGALEIDLLITVAAFKQVHMRVVEPPSLDTDVEKGKAKADDAELLKPPAVMSTKIERMLAILEETRTTKPGEKTIIFSSFTQMLDLIESPLKSAGYKFVRYDGSMNVNKRTAALTALNTDPRTTVMIVSTKCGALGLNLNVANRVILLDVWWNSALDNQAIDRVHRIGQTKNVEVHRVVVPGTIEERMLVIQERKQAVANNALGEDGSSKAERLGLEELMYLFFGE